MVRLRRASHALVAVLFVLVGAVAPVSHVCVTMDGARRAGPAAAAQGGAPAHGHAHHGGGHDSGAQGSGAQDSGARDSRAQGSGAPLESCDCLSHCGVASPAALAPAAAATLPQARPAHAAAVAVTARPALARAAHLHPPATAPPLRSI